MKVSAFSQVSAPPSAPACENWARPTPACRRVAGTSTLAAASCAFTDHPARPRLHKLTAACRAMSESSMPGALVQMSGSTSWDLLILPSFGTPKLERKLNEPTTSDCHHLSLISWDSVMRLPHPLNDSVFVCSSVDPFNSPPVSALHRRGGGN